MGNIDWIWYEHYKQEDLRSICKDVRTLADKIEGCININPIKRKTAIHALLKVQDSVVLGYDEGDND